MASTSSQDLNRQGSKGLTRRETSVDGSHSSSEGQVGPFKPLPKRSHSTSKMGDSGSSSSRKGHRRCNVSRTVALRAVLLASLLAAVAICASVAYRLLYDAEEQIGAQTYESIANNAVTLAKSISSRKLQGSEVMATALSHILPSKDDWPFISIEGYIPISEKVASLSDSTTQSLMVFVDPSDAAAFENHSMQVFRDQGRPNTTGYSDFGFGIWKPDPAINKTYDDGRLHDTTGVTDWGGPRPMAVLMMHNQAAPPSMMYNAYSEEDRGIHLDSMLECVQQSWANSDGKESPQCAVITDMLELKIRPGPAGLLFQPVFPAHDPSVCVGFATTSIHWQEILNNIVPDYVNGLACVVETATRAYTYEIHNGEPILKGDGDLHDPAYTHLGKKVLLNGIQTGASKSATYTLTIYPTATMFNTFHTNSPVAVALGFFGAIAICTMIFFLYDHLMRRENHQRKAILEHKRRFVRFISHEIRTPLNTVCMGLELLDKELRSTKRRNAKDEGSDQNKATRDDIEFWGSVTEDINENAYVAVSILNDLLNYDKLESGDLKLEVGFVNIWRLVERTVSQFNIQAVNKQVDLQVTVERPAVPVPEVDVEAGTTAEYDLWNMYGDDVRIGQVLRNVISNALKFTPPNGTVHVRARHIPGGLPNAAVLANEGSAQHRRAGAIEISVKDSGVGLTKEQLKLMFSEGVQFDANRLQHGGGSGLGLSIAKGIVLQHGGAIDVESEGTGLGTTFIIKLPLAEFTPEEVDEATGLDTGYTTRAGSDTSVLDQTEEIRQLPPKHILVVDDAASSRKMLIRLLERAGHICIPAGDGQEAVDIIQHDLETAAKNTDHAPINNVLMDFEMPVMKGPEAAKLMRELGYAKTIIGITGNVLEEDVEYFIDHGADEVLAKPVRLDHINNYWKKKPHKLGNHRF